jgi:hypothetical protein
MVGMILDEALVFGKIIESVTDREDRSNAKPQL